MFLAAAQLLAEVGLAAGIPIGMPMGIPIGMAVGTSTEKKKQIQRIRSAMDAGDFSATDRNGKSISADQLLQLLDEKSTCSR